MPVINNTNYCVEIFINDRSIARSKKFELQKPMLYVHKLKLPISQTLLKLGGISVWISTPSNFIIIPEARVASNITFFLNGIGTISDITFVCAGIYVSFELPRFKETVKNLKRGKGIIIP